MARRKDVPQIAALQARLPELHPWSEDDLAAFLEKKPDGGCGILRVVRNDAGIDGFILVRAVKDEAEILSLGVHPLKQGTGIATLLLRDALTDLKALGVGNVYLEIRETNQKAYNLYRKQGFAPVYRRPGYYSQKKSVKSPENSQNQEDAVVMVKKVVD